MPAGGEGPASFFLAPVLLVVELLVYNPQGGEEIAEEEEEEGEATHEHLGEESGSGQKPGPALPASSPGVRLTCHSLHSGSRARLNNVSALKSCQNWEGGRFLHTVPARIRAEDGQPDGQGHRYNLRVQRRGRAAGR